MEAAKVFALIVSAYFLAILASLLVLPTARLMFDAERKRRRFARAGMRYRLRQSTPA
jgi:hypothetical protein